MENFFQSSPEMTLKKSFLLCLYNHLKENGCSASAQSLLREAQLYGKETGPSESLSEWWDSFSLMRNSIQLSQDQNAHLSNRYGMSGGHVGANEQGTFKVPINYRDQYSAPSGVVHNNTPKEAHGQAPRWKMDRPISPLLVPGHAPLVVPKDTGPTDRRKSMTNADMNGNPIPGRNNVKEPSAEHGLPQTQSLPGETPHELNSRQIQPPLNLAGGNINEFSQHQQQFQQQKFNQQKHNLQNLRQMQQRQQQQQQQHFQQQQQQQQQQPRVRQQEMQRNNFDPQQGQHPQQVPFQYGMNGPNMGTAMKPEKNVPAQMMESKKHGTNAREKPKPHGAMISEVSNVNGAVMGFAPEELSLTNGIMDTNINMSDLDFESIPRERALNAEEESQNHAGMMASDSYGGVVMDSGILDGSRGFSGNNYTNGNNVMNLGFDAEGSDMFFETPLALKF